MPAGPPTTIRFTGTTMRLLFVCLGNICRSPVAEAVMRHLLAEAGPEQAVTVDSAGVGVGAWQIGQRADPRSRADADRRRKIKLLRAFGPDADPTTSTLSIPTPVACRDSTSCSGRSTTPVVVCWTSSARAA
jgi:hypothetical protein